jgi:TP901 family phage tail tape measure protein
MADVNANIGVNIDTSAALAQLKSLQRQISQFHSSIAKSSEAAALAQRDLQRNFLNSVNSIGAFSAELRTVKTTSESFTSSLEKNKFSLREYFRYAGASTRTFGKLFKSEYDTIGRVAEDRVKKLQTQYIKMGRDATGAMKAIAIIPNELDMGNYSTQLQIAAQKQALFNQLMKQGSTNLLNFGKNTQWAGRQLMVGFTLPLMAVGAAASKSFMQMEAQALKFKKVYGDLFTPQEETQQALEDVQALAREFTKYGVAVADTVGLAADAAAAGFQGLDLQRQTAQATRLSVLGQIDNQQALETTIALQNAFKISSEELAESIDFLNAVENQTVVSLDDVTIAIPKVAPVIKQLGGDVKDLAFFLTAMKEGGINASEGANALKSGLASLINPSTRARDMLQGLGIDINGIVNNNKGDIRATVIGFAKALDTLAPLERARAIEQMFGKFQFARLSALFANVTRDGTQASRVLQLAGSSVEDLANLSEQELGKTADSAMNKFRKSVEDLKFALVPVGEAFLKAVTPIIDFIGGIAEKFANLSDGTKKAITIMVTVVGGLGPVLLMTFGLLANGVANIIKLFLTLRTGYQKLTGQSQNLGEQTQYMTMEQIDAAAAAHSLNQAHATLTQQFTVEAEALQKLIAAYTAATAAGAKFAALNPGMMVVPPTRKKFADGGYVRGPGGPTDDQVPIMASNGEVVIPAATVNANKSVVDGLLRTGKFTPKVDLGGPSAGVLNSNPSQINNIVAGRPGVPQRSAEEIADRVAQQIARLEANKAKRLMELTSNGTSEGLARRAAAARKRRDELDSPLGMLSAQDAGRSRQVNVPNTYNAAHFSGSNQMSGKDLLAYAKTISEKATADVEAIIAGSKDGLNKLFNVFDNRVVALSEELNGLVGQTGSGRTAPIGLARKDLIDNADVRDIELVNQMSKAGVPIAEVKTAVVRITEEIEKGFGEIAHQTTVTAEDIDKITKKAYETVAAENKKVKAAYDEMSKVSTVADPMARGGKQERVSINKSYKNNRDIYGRNMEVMAGGEENIPYATKGAFKINPAMAAEAKTTVDALKIVYDQLSKDVQVKLSKISGDVKLFTKTILDEAKKAGIAGYELGSDAITGIAKGTGSASDSKKAIKEGHNVTNGFVNAIEGGRDEALAAGKQLGDASVAGVQDSAKRTRRVATRALGAPGIDNMVMAGSPRTRRAAVRPQGPSNVPSAVLRDTEEQMARSRAEAAARATQQQIAQQEALTLAAEKETAARQASMARMGKFNGALQGGSFALMSLSGVAQMFGGKLGGLSNIIFTLSGAMFAFQTIVQLATQNQLLNTIATRANTVAQTMGATSFKGLFAGVSGFSKRITIATKFLSRFVGIAGRLVGAVGLTVGVFQALNSVRDREIRQINGLSDAIKITTSQVKTLGDFFGVVPSKLPFDVKRGNEIVAPQVRSQRETLKADGGFQSQFKNTIKTLSTATAEEAQLAFSSLALNLKAQGFATEQVQTIIDALREESGKTDVVIDVKSLNLSPESIQKLQGQIALIFADFTKSSKIKPTGVQKFISGFIDQMLGRQPKLKQFTAETERSLNAITTFMSETAKSSAGMFQLGLINSETYTNSLNGVIAMTNNLDAANRKLVLTKVFESLGKGSGALLSVLKSAKQQMMGLALLSSGILDKDNPIFKALGSNDYMTRRRAESQLAKKYNDLLSAFTKVSGGDTPPPGDTPQPYGTNTDVLSKEAKLTIARLQKELDGLKTKRDLINEANDGLKRQYDYQQKLMQLSKDATQAKISGDYIGANILEQQKSFETGQFNKETDSLALDKKITTLENRISELQANARVTAAETSLNKAKKKGMAMGGLIKGPGTGRSDSIAARFAMGGLPQLAVSNGEYIVKASSVQKYGVGFMDALNNQKLSSVSSNTSSSSGNTVYNIDMVINGGDAGTIADQVIKRLKIETSKNNKSNMVRY